MIGENPSQYFEQNPEIITSIILFSQLSNEAINILLPQIKDIFFHSSSVKVFKSDEDKNNFFKRWCGDYIELFPDFFYLMIDDKSNLLGYMAVCPDTEAFINKLSIKSMEVFADQFKKFPAHLHMNTHENYRGLGLGSMLIRGVETHLKAKNIPGIFLITERNMQNFKFYERNGFHKQIEKQYGQTMICFMGKDLNS